MLVARAADDDLETASPKPQKRTRPRRGASLSHGQEVAKRGTGGHDVAGDHGRRAAVTISGHDAHTSTVGQEGLEASGWEEADSAHEGERYQTLYYLGSLVDLFSAGAPSTVVPVDGPGEGSSSGEETSGGSGFEVVLSDEMGIRWEEGEDGVFRSSLAHDLLRVKDIMDEEEEGELATIVAAGEESVPMEEWRETSQEEEAGSRDSGARKARWQDEDEEDLSRRFKLRNGREVLEERTYLIGIERKSAQQRSASFTIEESLEELSQLAKTAGLAVVGSTYQRLDHPNPRTYMGAGKVAEVKAAIAALGVETVIFDDELTPGQLRNLGKEFGDNVRVCDRTALILDIFSQRAATKEATLQVELAQTEYQLPRLTRMWSHLERQAGGLVKGMGEKQIEVDKRILRARIATLKKGLEAVREHRQQYRDRRAATPIPVISLVGYTNAGKSTLLNRVTGAGVLAEDKLFATLDPTTRKVELPNGKECLVTDTVGFIQKLPTQLVAAFRATLEEISEASLLLHVVDISHPMAAQQAEAVESVLAELDVAHIPLLSVWNKVDMAKNPRAVRRVAARRPGTVCLSALTGEGMPEFYDAVEQMVKDLLVRVDAVVPYTEGDLLDVVHRLGVVEHEEYLPEGTAVQAHVPLSLSRQLLPYSGAALQGVPQSLQALDPRPIGRLHSEA